MAEAYNDVSLPSKNYEECAEEVTTWMAEWIEKHPDPDDRPIKSGEIRPHAEKVVKAIRRSEEKAPFRLGKDGRADHR
jgi:hypothetical protein